MRYFCVISLYMSIIIVSPAMAQEKAFSQKAFMPDISLIFDTGYVSRTIDDSRFEEAYIPGFQESESDHSSEESHSHGTGGKGFRLNYAELSLAASVDPLFDLTGIFHLSEDSFEIEEIYATLSLPTGLQAVIGKFYSSFGRINSQHAHAWDFTDRPLVYAMMFGPEALLDTGLHINWLAPTDTYLRLGVEAHNGDNADGSFARGAFNADIEGDERSIEKPGSPGLFVLFAKSSVDIGGLSLLGGVSYAVGPYQTSHGEEAVDADSRVLGIDLLAKYYFSPHRYIAWQTEYLDRRIEGDRYFMEEHDEEEEEEHDDAHGHGEEFTAVERLTKNQAGLYSQLMFRFNRNLSVAGRYESLFKNDVSEGGIDQGFETDIVKWSLMAQWNFSEFSYARLQYNNDGARFIDGEREQITEVLLQLNFLIGAHPAHSF